LRRREADRGPARGQPVGAGGRPVLEPLTPFGTPERNEGACAKPAEVIRGLFASCTGPRRGIACAAGRFFSSRPAGPVRIERHPVRGVRQPLLAAGTPTMKRTLLLAFLGCCAFFGGAAGSLWTRLPAPAEAQTPSAALPPAGGDVLRLS